MRIGSTAGTVPPRTLSTPPWCSEMSTASDGMSRPSVGRSVVVGSRRWRCSALSPGAARTLPSPRCWAHISTTTIEPGGRQVDQEPLGGATGHPAPPRVYRVGQLLAGLGDLFPFAPSVFSEESISGVNLAIGWQDLEPLGTCDPRSIGLPTGQGREGFGNDAQAI
jgi:hypothetical protein